MTRLRLSMLALVLPTLLLTACSSGGTAAPTTIATTEPPLTVDTVLADAGTAMAAVESLLFTIEHEGADVFIDGDGGFVAFDKADGRFAAPDSADALVGVTAGSLATEVGAVAIAGQVWITNPLTGVWELAPDAFRFDPARIFSADVGLSSLLTEGLTDPVLTASEPDSDGLFHVTAGVDPERVSTLTSGLVKDVENVEIWIDAETSLLTKTSFVVATGGGDTSWILLLSGYGTDVTITEPELG